MTRKAAPKKAPKPKKPTTAYIVVREMVAVNESDTEPDRVFATRAAARSFADECNRELRQLVNPFEDASPKYLLEGGEKALTALIKKLRLPAPKKIKPYNTAYIDWEAWWDAHYFDVTDAQRDAIWDALDKFNWYRVKTTKLE